MNINRVFLIVLDSFGIGHAPDAAEFGDEGSNTLATIVKSEKYDTPNMKKLGLFNIDGVDCQKGAAAPAGAYGRLTEASKGKDTTIGHWEIAGIISENPMPVYPQGFPKEVLDEFSRRTGRGILCNMPYSGTEVIRVYGDEHVKTGNLIVYTSADSVFQIAAHEEVVPLEELYQDCRIAREILMGEHSVGRVIARPFVGKSGAYTRTPHRHDFSLEPPAPTMMDVLTEHGLASKGVGKIYDIFAGKNIQTTVSIENNVDGMNKTLEIQKEDFNGLCFVNLVDFDMLYGHRNDIDGYANAATVFDRQLGQFMAGMKADDVLMITADHGCDPGYPGTDHSRERIPILVYGEGIKAGVNLGTGSTFSDIAATVQEMFGLSRRTKGKSFWSRIKKETDFRELISRAFQAQKKAYAPYSGFCVGAALLCSDGKIYEGCNIENASYAATNCAERTAICQAVYEGEREFTAIAIVGKAAGAEEFDYCAPCGICRQVMAEFCHPEKFKIVLAKSADEYQVYELRELLPLSFTAESMNK